MPLLKCLPDWESIWAGCRKRIRRWRVPPNWSAADWLDEMESEGLYAALKARFGYNPCLGMAFPSYMHMKVIGHVVSVYRREWVYATRRPVDAVRGEGEAVGSSSPAAELGEALKRLDDRDRLLLTRLFWDGTREAEVARELGVSQQAINKRKKHILADLRQQLGSPARESPAARL